MAHIIVVGAGSAGCVVAARLSASGEHQVTLLEAGPDQHDPQTSKRLASLNWLDALKAPSAFTADIMATRLQTDAPRPYQRGRGVGGSGSVNAMLALPGLPEDYDRWRDVYGIDGWNWEEVSPWLEMLQKDTIRSEPRSFTPVDHALVNAAEAFGLPSDVDTLTPDDGAGALYRHADSVGRRSSRERYLDPVRSRRNLSIRPNHPVSRVVIEDGRAVGVQLSDQEVMPADEIILCAGAIETPAVLLRTGEQRLGVGQGLQDHPAASVFLELHEEFADAEATAPCINAVLRLSSSRGTGDIHILPVHGPLTETNPPSHGVLMAALMHVTSVGEVRLDPENTEGAPLVAERMLSTKVDRVAMREALRMLETVLESPPFSRIVKSAFIDSEGTPLRALQDPVVYQSWLDTAVGDYFHAVGTARMGPQNDPRAVVDTSGRVHGVDRLRVMDASVIPEVPRANTHLPTVMVAERLSATILTELQGGQATTSPNEESEYVHSL